MLLDHIEIVADDDLDTGKRFAVLDADLDGGVAVFLGHVDHVGDAGVAHHEDVAGAVVDLGGAHADLHDGWCKPYRSCGSYPASAWKPEDVS